MDFNQIRYFLALAETLNFTRAAERSGVTQPTLTQAIKRLEEELGGALIFREGRYSRLTKLGMALHEHFEALEMTRDTLKDVAKAIAAGEQESLSVGMMCTIGPKKLTPFLDRFQKGCPGVSITFHDLQTEAVEARLLAGEIDGAFAARHGAKHDRLDYIPLYSETMVVAFPEGHAFAKLDRVPLHLVAGERYIDRLHCEFRDSVMAVAKAQRLHLDVVFASEREDWIQDMVRSGVGVSVLPEHSLIAPMLDHRLVSDPALTRHVELVTVYGGAKAMGLRELIESAKDHAWTVEA